MCAREADNASLFFHQALLALSLLRKSFPLCGSSVILVTLYNYMWVWLLLLNMIVSFISNKWVWLLLLNIVVSLIGALGSHLLLQKPGRAHNGVKLLNELLSRSQLSYLSLYLTLFITKPAGLNEDWKYQLVGFAAASSFLCWLFGLMLTRSQDERLGHVCKGEKPCDERFSENDMWMVCRGNVLLSLLTFVAACLIIFTQLVVNSPPSPVVQENTSIPRSSPSPRP